jgi:hypothetical protein
MGIYDSGIIYGIRIYNFNEKDCSNTLLEEKYDSVMTNAQKREVYLFYNALNNKNDIHFKMYTECSSTYHTENCMEWYPMTLDSFLERFDVL